MSMIYLGIPEENVLEEHIEGIQRFCGSNAKVNSLASQYVQKLGMIIKRSTHENVALNNESSAPGKFADESDSFQNVKEKYIESTSWNRALQIPDSFTVDDKDHLFAKISSQKDSNLEQIVSRLSRLR
ncbi:hypothetical protein NC651_012770 [Populus alba x Populus x berolinensis]|nr:hypothetical protein NC651_012770 [Populus alba x Populus x berolinensis]